MKSKWGRGNGANDPRVLELLARIEALEAWAKLVCKRVAVDEPKPVKAKLAQDP